MMDKKEFATFAMALKTYYPRENLLPNNQAMELWYKQLQDIPYDVAEASLNKWVATNKWSPSIAEIREMATSVTYGELPTWGDAWEEVMRAIRNYGSYRQREAIESMSDLTNKAVERVGGFISLCRSENIEVDRANFRMVYEQLAARSRTDRMLPDRLKMLIEGMHEMNLLEGGAEENESKRIS